MLSEAFNIKASQEPKYKGAFEQLTFKEEMRRAGENAFKIEIRNVRHMSQLRCKRRVQLQEVAQLAHKCTWVWLKYGVITLSIPGRHLADAKNGQLQVQL